ncbi:Lysophospholipase L1 [Daejeonella rubra]|uniref:Lysophospholipase L1 n=1 Tax=Daejeonella rubra TaxID=990371 RepID=A0A1G9LPE4_9SPHI|nr:SGNH/GDSL hydrolase family protein [Daejeonella rubra]SDL63697.1 Lysophospholipase L1 [Daejeonella rubra]
MKIINIRSLFSVLTALLIVLLSTFSFAQSKKELTIVTFGNSTTAPRKGIEKVYAVRIHEGLTEAGITNKVINSGIGGSHTGYGKDYKDSKIEHGMDRFEKAVLQHHPDWVTMNFGLNDAYQDNGIGTASRIPIEKYIANLTYFITEIKKIDGKIILLTPNPLSSKLDQFRHERLKLYKDAVIKLARSENVELINSWKLFHHFAKKSPEGMEGLLPDGTHPMDTGHKLIAEKIIKIIKKKSR